MEIDVNTPPPLPPSVVGRAVTRIDGSRTACVSIRDAARLLGRSESWMENQIYEGGVDICRAGGQNLVLIDSLWLLVPEEDRRG